MELLGIEREYVISYGLKTYPLFIYQMENNGNKGIFYVCDHCDYTTEKKDKYNRHLETAKHNKNVELFNKNKEKETKKAELLQKKQEKEDKELAKNAELLQKKQEKEDKELAKNAELLQKALEKKQKEEDKKQKEIAKNADLLEKKLIKQQRDAEILIEKEQRALKNAKREAKQAKQEEKQELKEIAKIAKEKALIEDAIAIDWNDCHYNNIKDILKFNWLKEIEGNHFFSNLLLAIVSNEKLNCCRMKDKKYEVWDRNECKWISSFMEDEYTFDDVAYRLLDMMYDCPLLSKHKNRKEFLAYDLCKVKGNPLLKGVIRKILGGNGAEVLAKREEEINYNNEKALDEREEVEIIVIDREKRNAEMDTEEYRNRMNQCLADDNPFSIKNIKNWNYDVSYNKSESSSSSSSSSDDVLNLDGIERD